MPYTAIFEGRKICSESEWYQKMLHVNKHNTREIKINHHFVDVYDSSGNRGIEFQHSNISPDTIISRELTTQLDWIFDVTSQFCCIWDEFAFCEIPSNNWEKAIIECNNHVILDTGCKEWIHLVDKRSFTLNIEGVTRHMWIGKPLTLEEVVELTCLKNTLTKEGKEKLTYPDHMNVVPIIYARCKKSMNFLDPHIRQYALDIEYEKNMIYAIKSVAGSGKTTTLLKLAGENKDKRILYLAFNKAIVMDIKKRKTGNLCPYTFDAFIRRLYIDKYKTYDCNIVDLKPYTFGKIYPWFQNKPFKMKQTFISKFNHFCKDGDHTEMFTFLKKKYQYVTPFTKKQLLTMWQDAKNRKLITFNGLRKLAFIQHWFKDYIDENYDMVFIDEAQDFDSLMLDMLVNDTTVPKIFVGDPRQAIYEWRGAINAFKKLPNDAFIMEFYTTWRIGNPACDKIRNEFEACWMVAGNDHTTSLLTNTPPSGKYDYLFRSWRWLLQTAAKMPNVWINDFAKKKSTIEKLHTSLLRHGMSDEEKAKFEDDLPNFLLQLNANELTNLLDQIEMNSVPKKDADCRMYTIHAYKGMENDQIRIFNDIDLKEECNIYYVALTRGRKNIYVNNNVNDR